MIQQLCGVWVQDFLLDLKELEREIDEIPLRGLKGTTGTQVSTPTQTTYTSP